MADFFLGNMTRVTLNESGLVIENIVSLAKEQGNSDVTLTLGGMGVSLWKYHT